MHNSHLGSLPLHFHTAAGCSPVLPMNPAWSRVTGPKRFQQRSLPIESLRPLNLKVLCVFIYPNYSRLTVLAFLISCTPQEVERYRRNARDTSHACGTKRNTKSKEVIHLKQWSYLTLPHIWFHRSGHKESVQEICAVRGAAAAIDLHTLIANPMEKKRSRIQQKVSLPQKGLAG